MLVRNRWYSPSLVAAAAALLLGGLVGGAAAFDPRYALAGLLALGMAAAMLLSVRAGLLAVVATMTLLPFGTLPFKAIITPTLLELALAGLLLVWVVRMLARSDAYHLRMSPLGLPLLGFLGLTLFSLVLGAGGMPDSRTLHNYLKFVLGVLLFFSMLNVVRTRDDMRVAMRLLILCGGAAALVGLLLYALHDDTALLLLVQLGRIGYPTSGRVLRYVEDDTAGLERAIGTSVDPNSFGGLLALLTALAAAQLFAQRTVVPRWLLVAVSLTMLLALLLTFSRAALVGVAAAAAFVATVRYRHLWWVMVGTGLVAVLLLMGLGMAGAFVERLSEGVRFEDQAQQMRLAEYRNALAIIQRYPVFGIGFGSAPEIDLVAGVSSIYLTIGERMGLLGLGAFVLLVGAWFVLLLRAMPHFDDEQASWATGVQAGLVAALAVGLADHYFFNIEFSHMVALFWGCAGLGMALLALEPGPEP